MITWFRKWFLERERAYRYKVYWKAIFKGKPARVVNQSTSGMYIEVEAGAPIGSIVKFNVTIPDNDDLNRILHLSYEGKVVRTNQVEGRLGLGIELTKPVKLNETDVNYNNLWTKVK